MNRPSKRFNSQPPHDQERPERRGPSRAFDAASKIRQQNAGFNATSGDHLFSCLNQIANSWSDNPQACVNLNAAVTDNNTPTPEMLDSAAAETNLSTSYQELSLQKINPKHLPCILLLANGLGVIAVETSKGVLTLNIKGRSVELAFDAFQEFYAGVVILVKPRESVVSARGMPDDIAARSRTSQQSDEEFSRWSGGAVSAIFSMMWEKHRSLVKQLLLASALSNLFMITLPLFIMSVYDRVIPHLALETLWALALGVMIALCLDLGIRYVRLTLVDAVGLSTATSLQSKLYRHLVNIKMSAAPRLSGPIVTSLRDIDTICQTIPNLLVAVLVDLPFVLLVLVLIFALAGPVVLAPIFGILIIGACTFYSYRQVEKHGLEETVSQHAKMNSLVETVSNLGAIKATSSQNSLLRQWERQVDQASQSTHKTHLFSALPGQVTVVLVQVVIVLAVLIGVYQIAAGEMTVGVLAASTLLVGRVLSPIGNVMTMLARNAQLSRAMKRFAEFMEQPLEAGGDRASGGIKAGTIGFRAAQFSYPEAATPVISNITLTINPGEKVAIIGQNGCGKSTFLKLITRFYDPTSGSVTIDAHDARQMSPKVLRNSIAYMPQETNLFDASLRENIQFGQHDVSDDLFAKVVDVTGVNNFASRHPQGFGMSVGVSGERLSGGERQATILARTLLQDKPIILLDEPTSSMDNTAEAYIRNGLPSLISNKTLILTTHRASLLSLVDRIIWLDRGTVLADGPRDEVMAKISGKSA